MVTICSDFGAQGSSKLLESTILFAQPSRTAPLSSYYFLQPSPFSNILSNLNVICVCLKYSFLLQLVTCSFNSNTSQHLLYLSTLYVSVFICSMIPCTRPISKKSTGEQHNFRKYLHYWTKNKILLLIYVLCPFNGKIKIIPL